MRLIVVRDETTRPIYLPLLFETRYAHLEVNVSLFGSENAFGNGNDL